MITPIIDENTIERLRAMINGVSRIAITCHKSPDGDALGSTLALCHVLRRLGKDATVVTPDMAPKSLEFVPGVRELVVFTKHEARARRVLNDAQLIFCLDFNSLKRIDRLAEIVEPLKTKRVLIDHHLGPDVPAILTISHPDMSSTSELVFRIVWQLGDFDKLDKHFAVPVYCGMMTDTGGFLYNSSRPEIYFIIGELLTKHIDKDRIYRNVYHNYSEDRIRLMGFVLYQKLVYLPEYHAAFYTITREEQKKFHFIKGDAEGLVNIPQQIRGLKLSMSLREDSEKPRIWISLRSVDNFPCNKMAAEFFNGGGHLNASGGHLDMTIDEAVQVVRQALVAYADLLKG